MRANQKARIKTRQRIPIALQVLGFCLLSGWSGSSAQREEPEPPLHVPTDVAWTKETLVTVSSGDAFRGLLLARRCVHCHGEEGYSATGMIPNLAGMDRLSFWKQMQDFRSGKRTSVVMQEVASRNTGRDSADLAAYYSMLPTADDPQDNRWFPQAMQHALRAPAAIELILFGDASRGIPPCQACHGPVAFVKGAPPLSRQNGDYLREQLDHFASGERANDINVRMRTIARKLADEEKRAISEYYGAGLGPG
ncbi:MAG TPA: hypothetical protein VEH30_17660 [Terriglobales bacterium]|nr:hypothetical protein [Terriglobales bacterium]